jgi:prevent-host-death family protein
MKKVPLSELKVHLTRYLQEAGEEELVITRLGKPVGVLIGFASEDEWLESQLENSPAFLERIARARASLRPGQGVRLEDLDAKNSLRE